MEVFLKRKYIKMIAAILLFLTLFNFIVPRTVYAGLLSGIKDFFLGLVFDIIKLLINGILKMFFWIFDAAAVRF